MQRVTTRNKNNSFSFSMPRPPKKKSELGGQPDSSSTSLLWRPIKLGTNTHTQKKNSVKMRERWVVSEASARGGPSLLTVCHCCDSLLLLFGGGGGRGGGSKTAWRRRRRRRRRRSGQGRRGAPSSSSSATGWRSIRNETKIKRNATKQQRKKNHPEFDGK